MQLGKPLVLRPESPCLGAVSPVSGRPNVASVEEAMSLGAERADVRPQAVGATATGVPSPERSHQPREIGSFFGVLGWLVSSGKGVRTSKTPSE